MTLIIKEHRRPRWITLLIIVASLTALTAIGATVSAHSGVSTVPGNYFTVVDSGGANDVNSDQVDLTQMGRDDTDNTKYSLFWSWDSINSWTGSGQTGDACALFDTGTDGKIDKAVCARVANINANPASVQLLRQDAARPVYLFNCSNAKNDRCTQPSGSLPYTEGTEITASVLAGSTIAPNLQTDTDPFPAGQSNPHDTTIAITVLKSLVGNGNLVNVCSYPSAGNGGNNNPFDCIVNPGSGFLKIIKDAGSDTTTNFVFNVVPTPSGGNSVTITGSGNSGNLALGFTTTGSVTETVPSNWNLTAAVCTKQGGASTGSKVGNAVTGITIESGLLTTCTFTNARATGTLQVIKVVDNTAAPASANVAADFSYNGGGTSGLTGITAAAGPNGNSHSLNSGTTFNVAEVGVTAGKITVNGVTYSVSYSTGCSGTIASATTSTCTITNTAAGGTLQVIKVVDNTAAPASANVAADFSYNGGGTSGLTGITAAAGPNGNSHSLNSGTTFNVAEVGVTAGKITVNGVTYSVSYSTGCSGTIASATTSTCTITNTAAGGTLQVIKVVDNTAAPASANVAADFSYNGGGTSGLTGITAAAGPNGNSHSLNSGTTFNVAEVGVTAGKITVNGVTYSVSYSTGCSGTIASATTSTCTITNTAAGGTLQVIKVVDNTAAPASANVAADFSYNGGGTSGLTGITAAAGPNGNSHSLNSGTTFNVAEVGVTAGKITVNGVTYSVSYSTGCSGTIASATTSTCTITNTADKAQPGIGTTQTWTLNDSMALTSFRTGGTGGTATFSLYKDDGANTCEAGTLVYGPVVVNVNNTTGTAATTGGYTTSTAGTYRWKVVYSGNDLNTGITSNCLEVTTLAQ